MTGPEQDPRRSKEPAGGTDAGGTSPSEFAGLGLQFVIAILGGLYAGQWLDRSIGTAPWFLIIGVFLGAGLVFHRLYRKLMAMQLRDDAERAARRGGQ